ncbi:MAG: cation:proton antiporter [Deltaproteobacteria bacterium]|nr:cation:proton antiporter [Deltaproteobacteria bacterium]
MRVHLLVAASLVTMIWLLKFLQIGQFSTVVDEAALAFGFILLVAFIVGKAVKRVGLPGLTGYLFTGMIFGPYGIGVLHPSLQFVTAGALEELKVFQSIALGLIAFSAGGEMRLESVKKRLRGILYVASVPSLFEFLWVFAATWFASPYVDFGHELTTAGRVGVALIFGVIAISVSPAATIAIVLEYRAKGPMTTMVLGSVVVKDVLVIIGFSITLVASKILILGNTDWDITIVGIVAWEVFGSLGLGLLLGYILAQYMRYVGREMPLIVLALSFLAVELARDFHLSGLLLLLSAGFYVENYSEEGDRLVQAIDRYSLPVLVLFFTMSGAKVHLTDLLPVLPFVLLYVGVRVFAVWAGVLVANNMAGSSTHIKKYAWTGLISQAGVTLGLAALLSREFPEIGGTVSTMIVAAVAVNEIVGPILFREGLKRAGEVDGTDTDGDEAPAAHGGGH